MAKSEAYNMDCMEAMRKIPDKYFDIAVVDPPYGIGENGSKNHTRGKLATAKDYKAFSGGDTAPPQMKITFPNYSEFPKTRLSLEQTISFPEYRLIPRAGLCGTN